MFWQMVCEQPLKKNGTTAIKSTKGGRKVQPKNGWIFIMGNLHVTKEEIPGFWPPWSMGIQLNGTAQCFFYAILFSYLQSEHGCLPKCIWSQKFPKRTVCTHAARSTHRRGISECHQQSTNYFFKLSVSLHCRFKVSEIRQVFALTNYGMCYACSFFRKWVLGARTGTNNNAGHCIHPFRKLFYRTCVYNWGPGASWYLFIISQLLWVLQR